MTTASPASDLRAQIATITSWLTPTVERDCSKLDISKLRILRENLQAVADQLELAEEGLKAAPLILSSSLETLADTFYRLRHGFTATPETARQIVVTLTEMAATAWALEVHFRRETGTLVPEDFHALRLAHQLQRLGVTAGMPAAMAGEARK